ncbi:hypothetical protein [Desulfonatronovibrio hydrogenovorans]|uniref:hypothetical protein n=1 Tax=Desulfonatronovibrio hydrogenovorans TaxID=53245 RepID=UPI0004900961|nr:hypothetical protein [Desulfonatronovibrio hydrogenovorans]
MIKKLILLMVLGFLCMGMAGTGGTGPGMSETDRLFRATVIDGSDNSYQVQNLSVDGSTYLPAKVGSADANIDFGKVKKVLFYVQDEQVLARVQFVNDDQMDFFIQPQTRFLGQTDWGRISFQARDIKEISFR